MKKDYGERFKQRLDDYARNYRVEELNDSNDRSTLHMLVNMELTLESLQEEIQNIISSQDLVEKANEIKKLSDLIQNNITGVTNLQRVLAIDRKTRKSEETDSVAAYIRALKRNAKEFVEERLIKIYCSECNILVGRFSAVHDHTAFQAAVQCSQCKRWARVQRQERDIWFDLKNDSEWRRKYPVEIVPPSTKTGFSADDFSVGIEDELIIEGGDVPLV